MAVARPALIRRPPSSAPSPRETEPRGASECVRFEDEDFGGDVGVDVVGAHEGADGATRDLFDGGDAGAAHGFLVGGAHLEDLCGAVVLGEVALTGGECVLEHDDDHVAVDRGACLGRSAAGAFGEQADDGPGDRRVQRSAFGAVGGGLGRAGHAGVVLSLELPSRRGRRR